MEKEEETKLLKQGNVSIILGAYNDLFSDFDPRPTTERGLSVDFLDECKRAVQDKGSETELRFLVPKNKRNALEESLIKKRLKDHFTKHFHEKKREVNRIVLEGWAWFVAGVVISLVSAYLLGFYESKYIFKVLLVLTEPAGWFFFWEGLYKVFITSKEKRPEYEFYRKMISAKFSFHSY